MGQCRAKCVSLSFIPNQVLWSAATHTRQQILKTKDIGFPDDNDKPYRYVYK